MSCGAWAHPVLRRRRPSVPILGVRVRARPVALALDDARPAHAGAIELLFALLLGPLAEYLHGRTGTECLFSHSSITAIAPVQV